MVIKLKSLTESIEKKYLNESSLNEKYSDSMPDWLQDRLNYTQYKNRHMNTRDVPYPALKSDTAYNRTQKDEITGAMTTRDTSLDYSALPKADKLAKKGGHRTPSYQYRGGQNVTDDQENSLYYNFRKMGIPLDKVKIIEGPIPTKSTDPRLKEPNIPIFLLDDGQVYAKGINDNEVDPDSGVGFKHTSMKNVLSRTKAFAYIDGEDSSNFNAFDVKAERRNTAQDWRKYERNRTKDVDSEGQITRGFDKSGYPVPIDKWEKSNATYLSQYAKKQLESYREKLIEVIDSYKIFQANLFDTLKDDNTYLGDYDGFYERSSIGDIRSDRQKDLYKYVTYARRMYTKALEAATEGNDSEVNTYINRMSNYIDNANNIMEETGLMPKKLSVIDWI